ncbi:MAG: hypothetical protein VKI83_03665 [Synechococcaceae cyanobacterium]|nr:hypothetical protein [Synechococcaceae cyanobacterium]
MTRIAVLTLAFATAALASPALADSTEAFCRLSRHDHTIPVEEGPCRFSQRQGNVNVEMGNRWAFRFDSDADGKDYRRENTATGIRFSREGQYTLSVFWQKPAPRP